jgi:luciferase family oxidoreductase group 1
MKGEGAIHPTPGRGAEPEFWMLGSSLFGAQLAAKLGLPYAFASHFAPDHLDAALELYRRDFQPSQTCEKPHVMAAMNLFVADSEAEAEYLASSQFQAFVALRTGRPGKLPPPRENFRESLPPQAQAMLAHIGQASATGTPEMARDTVESFIARTGADEIVFGGSTYDPKARIRSLELAMDALKPLRAVA